MIQSIFIQTMRESGQEMADLFNLFEATFEQMKEFLHPSRYYDNLFERYTAAKNANKTNYKSLSHN